MYGCIIGKDLEGIWLIAEGNYECLSKDLELYKELDYEMQMQLCSIDKPELDSIKGDCELIRDRFENLFK